MKIEDKAILKLGERLPIGTTRHLTSSIERNRRRIEESLKNLENTLGERNPHRVGRLQGVGDPNLLGTEGIRWKILEITLREPCCCKRKSGGSVRRVRV
jgi:hypothetical protein